MIRTLSAAVVVAAASSAASAALVGIELRTDAAWDTAATTAINDLNPGDIGDYTVVRMYAVFDDNTADDVVLSAGHASAGGADLGFGLQNSSAYFYQDPFSGNTSPNSGLFGAGGFAPSAEWDTFVSIGRTSQSPAVNPDTTSTDPSFAFLSEQGGSPAGNQRFVQGGWFNSNPANIQGSPLLNGGTGLYETFLTQLTIRDFGGSVIGGLMLGTTLENNVIEGELTIFTDSDGGATPTTLNFVQVPTPGAAGLLGIAGLAAARRRRG